MKELLKNTPAYKIIAADKAANTLSHAYLVVCEDERMSGEYLAALAKLIACDKADYCDECRTCALISARKHSDVVFYPAEGKKLSVADADELVEESVVKPLELKEKLFVIDGIENLRQYQNKLLKTIEEPPANVRLLLGSVREAAVLPTIKSRVKVLSIPPFSESELMKAASAACPDTEKLSVAVSLSGGKLGEAYRIYNDDGAVVLYFTVCDMLKNMRSAKDVLSYADKLKDASSSELAGTLKVCLGAVQRTVCGGQPIKNELLGVEKLYTEGMLAEIITRIGEIEKSISFNANKTMVLDSLLFAVMEGKAKWQRLSV